MGLSNFVKLVTYHEVGHHMDYVMRMELLVARNNNTNIFEKVYFKNFINEQVYENYFKFWEGKKGIDEHLKRNFQENMADCYACIFFKQENPKISISKTIETLKKARAIEHNNEPNSIYSTYNSLDRLLINLVNLKVKTPHDIVNLVQTSAQEGLIMNLQELINNPKFTNLKNQIVSKIEPDKVLETVKKLKI